MIHDIKGELRKRIIDLERLLIEDRNKIDYLEAMIKQMKDGCDGGFIRSIDNDQKDMDIEFLLDRIEKLERVAEAAKKLCGIQKDTDDVITGKKKVSNPNAYIYSCAVELSIAGTQLSKALGTLDADDAEVEVETEDVMEKVTMYNDLKE